MNFDLSDYKQHLNRLVSLPSVSCAVPTWDMSNQAVIDYLANCFSDLGFTARVLPLVKQEITQPEKFNLIATLGSGDGGLVLAGHSDTVPYDASQWQSDPFQLTEKNNRLYGLGATDMKGFFPIIMQAVKPFLDRTFKHPLIVLATADEESSMSGARALVQQGLKASDGKSLSPRYAVIGEPTGLVPILAHKGIMMESIRVQGKSGHSSDPSLGKNALEVMNQVMTELLGLRRELQLRYKNSGFAVQTPTLNLGCIHGGDGANRICADCELHFDLRLLPGMDNIEMRNAIQQRLTPLAETSGTDIVFSSLFEGVNPFAEDAQAELVKVCEELTGHNAASVAFATEAPFMQELGMQTVVLGPGSIDQAHQPDEYIAIDQLAPAVKLVRQLIERFCF